MKPWTLPQAGGVQGLRSFRNGNPGLMLLQYPNDLLFGETAAFHVLVLMLSKNELQTGLSPWGNVDLYDAELSAPAAFFKISFRV